MVILDLAYYLLGDEEVEQWMTDPFHQCIVKDDVYKLLKSWTSKGVQVMHFAPRGKIAEVHLAGILATRAPGFRVVDPQHQGSIGYDLAQLVEMVVGQEIRGDDGIFFGTVEACEEASKYGLTAIAVAPN